MKLKLVIALLIAVGISGLLGIRAENKPKETQWLGNATYYVEAGDKMEIGGKEYEVNKRMRQGWTPDVEIGLRDDGVVVWRKKP